MTVLRVAPSELAAFLPTTAESGLSDHIYLIDPLQNLMMRFPSEPDPAATRNDLQRLLKASRIG
jgi:hypothetical protein